jgi:hypothetical protein
LLDLSKNNYNALIAKGTPLSVDVMTQPGGCGQWSIRHPGTPARLDQALSGLASGWDGRSKSADARTRLYLGHHAGSQCQIARDISRHPIGRPIQPAGGIPSEGEDIIAGYTQEELFTPKRYTWNGSTSLGAYTVSVTSRHHDWAIKLIRSFLTSRSYAEKWVDFLNWVKIFSIYSLQGL